MKAHIQIDAKGEFYNVNAYVAWIGFKSLGFEIEKFFDAAEILDLERDSVVAGGVGMVRKRLSILGIDVPPELEYPETLTPFLGREIWQTTLKELIISERVGLFIKPVQTKLFPGKVIHAFKDYIGLNFDQAIAIWCSELVDISTEWRCFVRYGEILDVRYYKGDWDNKIDLSIVRDAIKAFTNQPAAYCLDFGIDKKGKYYLIEVNDGHSLGTYGMGAISYAKFLSAR